MACSRSSPSRQSLKWILSFLRRCTCTTARPLNHEDPGSHYTPHIPPILPNKCSSESISGQDPDISPVPLQSEPVPSSSMMVKGPGVRVPSCGGCNGDVNDDVRNDSLEDGEDVPSKDEINGPIVPSVLSNYAENSASTSMLRGRGPDGPGKKEDHDKRVKFQKDARRASFAVDPSVKITSTIFDLFRSKDDKLDVGDFLAALKMCGIRKTDPRLAEMMNRFDKALKEWNPMEPVEALWVDRNTFDECIRCNIELVSKILQNKLVIPDWPLFTAHITNIYYKCQENTSGKLADYIPQLARVNPEQWAVAVCSVDGQRFATGPVSVPFCIQSGSKPLSYALVLDDLGAEVVHKYVGQEPSGRVFNDLVLDSNNKPHNPMINSGAIMVCSLIKQYESPAERYDYVLRYYKDLAGGEFIGFNNAVFLSERNTADRNFALAYYMRENQCFPDGFSLQETLDLYFQLCSVEVTAESGSVMAATLANGGFCPTTGERVIDPQCVRDVLSLMYSCGMYDYSGQFAFKIGLPSKSGVSGVVFLVVPNVCGICTWSPRLDRYGNSVRGVLFCEKLVQIFNFHNYDNLKQSQAKKLDPRRQELQSKGESVVNLLFSAANGDVTALRRYLLQGLDLGVRDYDSRTALHLAAAEGHEECVRFLLMSAGVEPEPRDRWGYTPAEEAKKLGFVSIVNLIRDFIQARDDPTDEEEEVQPESPQRLPGGLQR